MTLLDATDARPVHFVGATTDEDDALEYTKALLSYLPQNNLDEPPAYSEPADM